MKEKIQNCNSLITENEIEQILNQEALIKSFTSSSAISRDFVFIKLFGYLKKLYSRVFFLDLDIEQIINRVSEQREEISKLHDNISRKIWKSLLEKIVILYFQCLIISCNKASNEEVCVFYFKTKLKFSDNCLFFILI